MSEKPSYLGLLNAIALGESRAHAYLTEWVKVSPDPDVRAVLSTVAAREGEHGMSFAKRINELGYSVRDKEDPGFEKRMAIACSSRSDLEKMEKLGLGRLVADDGQPDFFDTIFADHSIDIQTGELLGRYIAEERDSGQLLRCCYEQLKARSEESGARRSDAAPEQIAILEGKVDALCQAVDEIRQAVCGNGSTKTKKAPAGR